MEEEKAATTVVDGRTLVDRMAEVSGEIASISDFRNACRKQFCDLSRRMKLLAPMFDELKESKDPVPERAVRSLTMLDRALDSAKELLQLGNEGSKIFLVLESDRITNKFQDLTAELVKSLEEIPLDILNLSDEVAEQVELVRAQLKRAKERVDTNNVDLHSDLLSVYNLSADANADPLILHRLAERMQLKTISDLKQESLALHEMVVASDGDPGESIEKMSMLLKKIKDFMQTQNPEMGTPTNKKNLLPTNERSKPPIFPDDFRCPISLELMKDPVIVATGQTYDREFIEEWLAAGHDTCPKTQQKLSSKTLTPNYVLRSLIAQWCEANDIDPPKRPAKSKPQPACSSSQHAKVLDLVRKLSSRRIEDQRSAAADLRLLARLSDDNRSCIAEAGAIPLLVNLLSTLDVRTQENAVTALLNLSIYESNKEKVISTGAVPGIVHVLRRGSMEARENAAATLFSLSVIDDFKVRIGNLGAIPPLVSLLREGSQRGKKDAVLALFNLCIYQGNKGKAVRAGLVPILVGLLVDPEAVMLDETLATLAILSSHPEGKAAIAAAEALPALIEVIKSGSPRNKENAAATLAHLFSGEHQLQYLAKAYEKGLVDLLIGMAKNGTDRGKRKAVQLLQHIQKFLKQQKEAQAHEEVEAHAQAQALAAESSFPISPNSDDG
ncbi:protein spotted leaf 11 [Canna indica]|uniref:U-box domain-containing protein 12 n=1 Tax=Canna indica TaxID=4628 RepID=A0AAQ3KAC6_9LILI|nr:protein spotted leaf 11 [Canna indica]